MHGYCFVLSLAATALAVRVHSFPSTGVCLRTAVVMQDVSDCTECTIVYDGHLSSTVAPISPGDRPAGNHAIGYEDFSPATDAVTTARHNMIPVITE
ncbi:Hypothetical protein CINCED_3A020756 [Cinara cedri]|uniref:Uncharacterized protein n=1 Tax=Cinara cedri TaxID=506608 RepID=A0A5E4MFZ5_9HEMI|nr:Hypothetical protein CINCED_3A020756 [Cinara cedri]